MSDFEITVPTPTSILANPTLQGASQHAGDEELPLIVWLRGDEEYFSEFSLDADAVMKELGIKRSRLTQISGRELRVGRVRVDRYTRPMYRPEDVSAYQKWTRATASHLRSSSVMSEAAQKLESQSEQLFDRLLQQIKIMNEETIQQYDQLIHSQAQGNLDLQSQLRAMNEDMRVQFLRNLHQNSETVASKVDELKVLMRESQGIETQIARHLDEIQSVKASIAALTEHLNTWQLSQTEIGRTHLENWESTKNSHRDFGKALSLIIQFQREQLREHESTRAILEKLRVDLAPRESRSDTEKKSEPILRSGSTRFRARVGVLKAVCARGRST